MNISEIKGILASGDVPAHQVNLIISSLSIDDLNQLSDFEKEGVREIISKASAMAQDPSSGAYIDDPDKAKLLLSALD